LLASGIEILVGEKVLMCEIKTGTVQPIVLKVGGGKPLLGLAFDVE
jgi:hypothetical protein